MNEIDRVFHELPVFGKRQIAAYCRKNGVFHAEVVTVCVV